MAVNWKEIAEIAIGELEYLSEEGNDDATSTLEFINALIEMDKHLEDLEGLLC